MKRRSFLKAVTAAAPAAGLQSFLVNQALSQIPVKAPAPANPSLQVVGAGEDRFGHPHSLGFSSILIKVPTTETTGGLFVIEHTHLLPGGPALHLHLNQEEWFYVIEGQVAFQVGDQRLQLKVGQSVLAPRRVPHAFSSLGATPSRMLIAFCPAGRMEQYFLDAEKNRQSAFDAEFMRRYEMELVGPSPFWPAASGQTPTAQVQPASPAPAPEMRRRSGL